MPPARACARRQCCLSPHRSQPPLRCSALRCFQLVCAVSVRNVVLPAPSPTRRPVFPRRAVVDEEEDRRQIAAKRRAVRDREQRKFGAAARKAEAELGPSDGGATFRSHVRAAELF